jgi:glycosyltransferase involved in cell wall biosynthesis
MRVLLVGDYPPEAQTSMQRYAAWLENELRNHGVQVHLVKPKIIFSRLCKQPLLAKYLGYIDKYLVFLPSLRSLARQYDMVHVLDHSNSMYLSVVGKVPSLITCHDLLAVRGARGEFPEYQTPWSGKLLQKWILSGLKKAPNIVCVSAATAADLKVLTAGSGSGVQKAPVRKAPVQVIYNALNWNFTPGVALPAELCSRLGLNAGQPYLLHVGNDVWYKNRSGAVDIFEQLASLPKFHAWKLVMAGQQWSSDVREAIASRGLSSRIIEALTPTNPELAALYSNARALLFPSLYEGFGWPILEAQACGCPVITTERAPMTEVAGGAAILIDPADPARAAATIAEGMERSQVLREAGFRNLERFDGQKIIAQYLAVYADVLEQHRA